MSKTSLLYIIFSQSSQPGPNLIFIEFFSRKKDFPDSWANIMTMNATKHIETFLKTCSQNILFDPEYIYLAGYLAWQTFGRPVSRQC